MSLGNSVDIKRKEEELNEEAEQNENDTSGAIDYEELSDDQLIHLEIKSSVRLPIPPSNREKALGIPLGIPKTLSKNKNTFKTVNYRTNQSYPRPTKYKCLILK